MTIDKDPVRLSDSASPEDSLLRDALRQARNDLSPDDAIARMLAHFPPGPGTGGGQSAPDTGAGKGGLGAGKGGLGPSTSGAGSGTSTSGAGSGTSTLGAAKGGVGTTTLVDGIPGISGGAGAGKGVVTTVALAKATGAGAPTSLLGSILVGALAGAVVSFGLWATDADTASPPPPSTSLTTPAPGSTTHPVHRDSRPETAQAEKPSSPTPAQKAGSDSASRTTPLQGTASPPDSPSPPDPAATSNPGSTGNEAPTDTAEETEGAFLARAQALLSANPSGALALAEQHRSRYPKGALGQEREVIAITALVGMGRTAEARTRAESLLAGNPSSAHRRRLSRIVPGLSPE